MTILFVLLTALFYECVMGYRWAVLPQSRLDLDLAFGVSGLALGLFALFNIPIVYFVHPIRILDPGLPLSPLAAAFLLTAIGGLQLFFSFDDIRSFRSGVVSRLERIDTHVFRTMAAMGGCFTAIFIVHLGPVLMRNDSLLWMIYVIPPTLFAAVTFFVRRKYLAAVSAKANAA